MAEVWTRREGGGTLAPQLSNQLIDAPDALRPAYSESLCPKLAGYRDPNGMFRRDEPLAVATKLFAARGYDGTRMDDVADASA